MEEVSREELVAKAITESFQRGSPDIAETLRMDWQIWVPEARAAIAALSGAQVGDDGSGKPWLERLVERAYDEGWQRNEDGLTHDWPNSDARKSLPPAPLQG